MGNYPPCFVPGIINQLRKSRALQGMKIWPPAELEQHQAAIFYRDG